MKISTKGIRLLVRFEGEILEVYKDPIGLPTLGVGHLLTAAELKRYPVGTPISKMLSRQFLSQDLDRFEIALGRLVTVPLTQNQYDALCSIIFNIGIGAFTRSTLLKKLNRKDYQGAADAFMSWVKAGGGTLPGLVTRRRLERKLFLAPDAKSAINADDGPALGGGEAQPSIPSAPPPSQLPVKKKSLGVGQVLELALGAVDRTADAESRIGRSRWAVVALTKSSGFILALFADYWYLMVLGVLLIGFSSWYLWRANRNALKESSNPTS